MVSEVLLVLILMGLISLHYQLWKSKMLAMALIDVLAEGTKQAAKQHVERRADEAHYASGARPEPRPN
jgi:hypothetical protein